MTGEQVDNIVLFDGVCNFCNASVNCVLRNDRRDRFHFAALQSDTGKIFIEKYKLKEIDSVIFIHKGKAYTRSSAFLHIAKRMDGLYPLLFFFIIVPRFIRDVLYDYVARNRYRWFGKRDACMVPTPADRAKFLN